jgi:hypothetical protein
MSTNSPPSESAEADTDQHRRQPSQSDVIQPPLPDEDIKPDPEDMAPIGGPRTEPQGLWQFRRADRL